MRQQVGHLTRSSKALTEFGEGLFFASTAAKYSSSAFKGRSSQLIDMLIDRQGSPAFDSAMTTPRERVDDASRLSRCDARRVGTYPGWGSDHFGRLGIDPRVACEREVAEGADRQTARDLQEHGRKSGRLNGSAAVLAASGDDELRAV